MESRTKDLDLPEINGPKFKYFFRQLLIASGAWNVYFTIGLFLGSPTVFIPQMRQQANSTDYISQEMASWLSSIPSYSAFPWVLFLPNLARIIGRKRTSIVMSLSSIIAYIIFYFSSTTTHLIISEIFIGVPHGSTLTITIIVISEYTSPKYRGIFLALKSASLFWGIWVSNVIGTFVRWTYIPLVGLICSIYSLTVFLWPESPQWLASKGKYNDCRNSHRWLKGTDYESEKELDKIIKYEINCLDEENKPQLNLKSLRSKELYMPLTLSIVAIAQYHLSGKFVFSIYAIDMIKKIVDESSVYKTMLILDGITVFSAYIGCVLSKILRRRTLLITSCTVAIIFLFAMSLYLFLVKLGIIVENMYFSILLLGVFSFSISTGPMILSTSLVGELIPTRYKSISLNVIGLSFVVLQGTTLKLAPKIFKTLSIHGTFLFYGILSTILVIFMYFYLPETKDKTLLEIEEYFKDGKRVDELKTLVPKVLKDERKLCKQTRTDR